MRRKKERSKQGQTNKQGKATQHTQWQCIYLSALFALHVQLYVCVHVHVYTRLQDSQPPTSLVVDPLPLPTANVINMMVSAARPCIMEFQINNNYYKC